MIALRRGYTDHQNGLYPLESMDAQYVPTQQQSDTQILKKQVDQFIILRQVPAGAPPQFYELDQAFRLLFGQKRVE